MAERREAEQGLTEEEKAEVRSTREVLLALQKAVRGFAMYLPNNPLHRKFFEELVERMNGHLGSYGRLRLELMHDRMTCLGETVYENDDPRESLAFRMYADGIRIFFMSEGLEEEELRTCLHILSRDRREDDDEDIVTELWVNDLPHVSFILAEDTRDVEPGDLGARPEDASRRREGLRRIHSSEPIMTPQPVHPMMKVPQAVFTLSGDELESLRLAVTREQERQPLEDVGDILRAILLVERDKRTFVEFIETMGKLCRDLIIMGHIDYCLRLSSLMAELARSDPVPQEHKAIVFENRGKILDAEAVDALGDHLNRKEGVTRVQIRDLVLHLGTSAIMNFCLLLGKVERRDMRKSLVEGLAAAGRYSPESFFPFLTDDRWYLVRNTVHILTKIRAPEASRHLTALVGHKDHRVRGEVLLYFDGVPGEEGTRNLLRFLEDDQDSFRISAVKALARRRAQNALEPLLELTGSPRFASRSLAEREAFYEALGEISPEGTVPLFRDMLMRRYWFRKNLAWERAVCALSGLRGAGTAEALQVVVEAHTALKGRIRTLVGQSLEEMKHRSGAEGGGA